MIITFYSALLLHMVEPAVRAALLALLVGATLALFRVKNLSLRLVIWTSVLYTALSLPFLGLLLPGVPLRIPVFRPSQVVEPVGTELLAPPTARQPRPFLVVTQFKSQPPPELKPNRRSGLSWPKVMALLYVVVTSLLALRLVFGLAISRGLRRSAQRVTDRRILSELEGLAKASGLSRLPPIALSRQLAVPVTVGAFRPWILLPAAAASWEGRKWRAVLAHELAHVARRDPLTQMLSTLHRCFFWFSPLSWWLDRQLSELIELVSDEAALRAVTDHIYFAEVLMEFMNALQGTQGRVRCQGAAMVRGSIARRLERILAAHYPLSKALKKRVVATLIAVVTPVVFLAATVMPCLTTQLPARPAPAAPAAPSVKAPPPSAAQKPGEAAFRPGPLPVSPAASSSVAGEPTAPQEVSPPRAPEAPSVQVFVSSGPNALAPLAIHRGEQTTASFATTSEEKEKHEAFVVLMGEWTAESGSDEDLDHVRALRKKIKGDFIWFRHDGKAYIIRDVPTINTAKGFFAPEEALGSQQQELGRTQAELGRQQGELGKKQSDVRVGMPNVMKQLKKLEAEFSDASALKTQEDLARFQAELGDLQSKLADAQAKAGEAQSRLGTKQAELGSRQAELGKRQAELGDQQEIQARRAEDQMKQLLEHALSSGLAEPEPR